MIIPAILVIVSITLHHFLPSEVINYWHHAYKIDMQQSNTLSKLVDQLTKPMSEIINLITTVKTSPLSIAILANIMFVAIATIIFLAIIVSFMFYTENNSPARIVTEHVIYFLTN